MAEPRSLREQLDDLDRRFGKGRTYSAEERKLILDRIVPEHVIRGARFGSGPLKERCTKAIESLKAIHVQVTRELPVGKEADGA